MPGIWVAVKATTRVSGSSRKTVLKSWKSRPPAPMITTVRMVAVSFGWWSAPTGQAGADRSAQRVADSLRGSGGRSCSRVSGSALEGERLRLGGRPCCPPAHPDVDRDAGQQQQEALEDDLVAGTGDRPQRVAEGQQRDHASVASRRPEKRARSLTSSMSCAAAE